MHGAVTLRRFRILLYRTAIFLIRTRLPWALSGNIYVNNILADKILVYAAGSTGNVAPIQNISGPKTELLSPSGIAVSPLNGDIYVANETNSMPHTPKYRGCVLIFPQNATGDTPPKDTIAGVKTNLDGPIGLAFDATGKLYVANQIRKGIAVFAAGSVGNVAPIQVIAGKATQLAQAQQAVPTRAWTSTRFRLALAKTGTPSSSPSLLEQTVT
jgi:DNA-binding beta-propeller fold protein YncE